MWSGLSGRHIYIANTNAHQALPNYVLARLVGSVLYDDLESATRLDGLFYMYYAVSH